MLVSLRDLNPYYRRESSSRRSLHLYELLKT